MGHGAAGFTDHHRQALDGFAGFPGDIAATAGQPIGFLGGVGRALDMAGDFQGGGGHLVDGGGHLFGFLTLAVQAIGTLPGQLVGLAGLGVQVFGGILQAGQAGFQACLLAENGHLQARLGTSAVGVHLRDQRVRGGLFGQA